MAGLMSEVMTNETTQTERSARERYATVNRYLTHVLAVQITLMLTGVLIHHDGVLYVSFVAGFLGMALAIRAMYLWQEIKDTEKNEEAT